MKDEIRVSPLRKTWILDLDGTIVKHNGPYIDGKDSFLEGAREFLESIDPEDTIIFLTARYGFEEKETLSFLKRNHVRYDHIIFGAGHGERILINDSKPDGLKTAIAVNTERDVFCRHRFVVDRNLNTMYD